MRLRLFLGILFCAVILSCSNNDGGGNTVDCSTPTFVVEGDTAFASITITSPLGSNYTYSIDGSDFSVRNVFTSLYSGRHTIIAKDENGCTASAVFTVDGCISTAVDGVDTGYHTLFIADLNPGLAPIRDTLEIYSVATSVIIDSKQIKRGVFNGIISCNTIQLDSIIFSPTDTIRIPTATLPVQGGVIKLWNIRAGGFTTIIDTSRLDTRINIANGNTNITSPVNLTNLAGKNINFRGIFYSR